MILLKAENVGLSYKGKATLKDVNIEIRDIPNKGQVVGLLGPSGVGKTWFFRILAGLHKPDTGVVKIGVEQKPVKAGDVGVVTQNYKLFDHHTALANLLLVKKNKTKVHEMLARFGLYEQRKLYPKQLSGGQRQRLAIAQQILCSKYFLLMDEPFSGLDPISKDTVCKLIGEVASQHEHNTIIVVTHDIEAALAISDTVWLMGLDKDEQGNALPGAKIKESYCLVERGLAWQENVQDLPAFNALRLEIHHKFKMLR